MRFLLIAIVILFSSCQEKEKVIEIVEIHPINHKYKFSEEIELKWKDNNEPWRFQSAGTDYSFIGNYKKISDNFYRNMTDRKPLDDSSFNEFSSSYRAVNAVSYIIERAKNEQIVIVNEAHHKSKSRIITTQLLQELYKQGFRYFGAETFGEIDITDMNMRKYPIYLSGHYLKEPQFGNLVREALQVGFEVFHYENTGGGSGKPREISQAKNIQSFLMDKPKAKTLIHCGYQHAQEGTINGSWEKAMAGRVLEYTGINPLTINQTKFDNKFEFKHLSPLQKRIEIEEPTVFVDSKNHSYEGKSDTSGFDIMVFHEQTKYENGRPTWLVKEDKKWVKVDISKIKLDYPYFLFAFHKDENYTDAIPVDILEITDSTKTAHFALEQGQYNVVAQSILKKAILFELEVD